MRVAVIDCGTNTVRLLVAESGECGLTTVVRDLRYVRLGEGVDAHRRFQPAALARTFAAVEEYAGILEAVRPERVRFIATSAARDAANRDEFLDGVEARLGVRPEVITGDEEARLSFVGALAGGPVWDPVLVSDVGGGSTELILGDAHGVVRVQQSLDVGSVRLRERFLHDDPPTAAQIGAARRFVGDLLDGSRVPLGQARTWLLPDDEMFPEGAWDAGPARGTWIGVAGTTTSAAALVAGLTVYDPAVVHNSTVAVADILALSERLLRLSTAETMRRFPVLAPLRAEVIGAGVMIVAELARRVDRPLVVRETDILDGAADDLIRHASP